MFSIDISRIPICAALLVASCTVVAAETPPPILREPVLSLRYETARVKFDPLPAQALANCETLADNEHRRSVWFLYGQARDASGRTFYIGGGYDVWYNPLPHQKYDVDDLGVVFVTERGTCTTIDNARQPFEDRLFDDEMPQAILKQLAGDLAQRYVRAFGGADKLQAELRNQRIHRDSLPPELREAFKPYFGR